MVPFRLSKVHSCRHRTQSGGASIDRHGACSTHEPVLMVAVFQSGCPFYPPRLSAGQLRSDKEHWEKPPSSPFANERLPEQQEYSAQCNLTQKNAPEFSRTNTTIRFALQDYTFAQLVKARNNGHCLPQTLMGPLDPRPRAPPCPCATAFAQNRKTGLRPIGSYSRFLQGWQQLFSRVPRFLGYLGPPVERLQ